MTMQDEYRCSTPSRPALFLNQVQKRRSRQLSPLSGSENRRRTPKIYEDNLQNILSHTPEEAVRQSSRISKASIAKSAIKLQKLLLNPNGPETGEHLHEILSNQDPLVQSKSRQIERAQARDQLSQCKLPFGLKQNKKGVVELTLTDVPLQLLQGSRVDLRRWSVIVSDQTLRRLAAHNHRITNINRKAQTLSCPLSPSRQHSCISSKEELQQQSLSCSKEENQPTESLLLRGSENITNAGLAAIALAVPKLKQLDINGAGHVTDTALRVLGEKCPQLERLDLSAVYNVRGAGLAALVDRCGTSLTHLSIAACRQLGDWVIRRCFYAAPQLTHLNLSNCPQVEDALLNSLASQCPLLQKLELNECLKISDQSVVRIAQSCPHLEYVALNRPIGARGVQHLTDLSCSALGTCQRLRVVLLAGSRALTDAGVHWMVSRCTHLTSLDLTGAVGLTDATCAALGKACPELRSLRINGVKGISDVGLRHLSTGCTKLELLHAANVFRVSDGSNRDFGLEGLRAIATKCSALRDLNLNGCFQLQERALVAVGMQCSALQRLSLQACPNITLVAITAVLKGCQHLSRLDLSGVRQCDDRMLRAVAKYGSVIAQLLVAGCDRIGDAGLCDLAAMRADQLELLDLTGCLSLSDAGLNALCDAFQRPKLTHLILVNCSRITEDPVTRLAAACPQLLTLNVHGCHVSARVLHSLSSSWPFSEVRLPPSGSLAGSSSQMGMFPMPRAKDRRYIAETSALWVAAATIQNLFRARVARRLALKRRETALQHAVARRLQSIWRGRQARRQVIVLKIKVSHLESCATLIQRRYRAARQARRKQRRVHDLYQNKQAIEAAVLVQRRYRAMRAGSEARRLVARYRHDFARKTHAALVIQHHYQRRQRRNKLRLLQAQKLAHSRRMQSASVQIQRWCRGRTARQVASTLRKDQRRDLELQQRCALRMQAQFRRVQALRTVKRRRNVMIERQVAVTKLQSVFRARRGRQRAGLLRLKQQLQKQEQAARRLQRHWRTRQNCLALVLVAESRRVRNQQRLEAAVVIQHFVKKFLVRRRARNVVSELLVMQKHGEDVKRWALTLVQAYWRRREACRRVREVRKAQRTRWKQLIDSSNEHGAGYGAPFFYDQVNGEIRWRLPRDLLSLTTRPTCAQCEVPESASVECATCSDCFCKQCFGVVHGGKRRLHNQRELFDFYGRRRDYGDGYFPSIWPSEILQDTLRGYDFVQLAPRDNYQEMVQEILNFVPVATGSWDDE